MCGIAGIFDTVTASGLERGLIQRMNNAIAHRGPDGDGIHLEPGVALAHRRLAIIDLSGGQQPMFNEDGSVSITFNGEIYNYKDLIPELQQAGHVFRTRSDTEVIVHAWEEWGPDCVNRLRGMFAFAIHDRNRQCLFLARDRFGKKPLYYTLTANGQLLFASELKAILSHPNVAKRLNARAVDNYLAFGYVPDPDSIYDGILKLPPAHHMTIVRGRSLAAPQCYWRLHFTADLTDEEEARRALEAKLEEATRIRLMSEVPLGAFLSGGVDSSGVVAMMAHALGNTTKTFAVGFGEDTDELHHAQRVAERYKTEHRDETVNVDPVGVYRAQAAIFGEPFADNSAVPTYHVSKFARRYVTVALSGDAGDENFAGYRRYRLYGAAEKWRGLLPLMVRRPVFGALAYLYPKLDWAPRWLRAKYTFAELASDSAFGYYRTVCKIQDPTRQHLYSEDQRRATDGHDASAIIAEAMAESGTDDPISRAQYADMKTYLAGDILTKVDRASMAVSLEVRVPMLDHEFAELAARIPSGLKIKNGEQKYILKRMLEPHVPHENLYRQKQGFATSLAPYFRGLRAPALKAVLTGTVMGDSGLFDVKAVAAMADAHAVGRADHSQALWSLLMFEGFLREVHFRNQAA